jgi:hypothetical protein
VERTDTRGHRDPLHNRTLKACEEIPVEQQARPGGADTPIRAIH